LDAALEYFKKEKVDDRDINSDDISNYLELSGSKFIHPRGANCLLSWVF
jgi:hypothetical protein